MSPRHADRVSVTLPNRQHSWKLSREFLNFFQAIFVPGKICWQSARLASRWHLESIHTFLGSNKCHDIDASSATNVCYSLTTRVVFCSRPLSGFYVDHSLGIGLLNFLFVQNILVPRQHAIILAQMTVQASTFACLWLETRTEHSMPTNMPDTKTEKRSEIQIDLLQLDYENPRLVEKIAKNVVSCCRLDRFLVSSLVVPVRAYTTSWLII